MTNTKLPELPEPALTIGTKLLPYEERSFGTPGMATALGYTYDQRHYHTADQLRAYGDEREAYGRATAPAEVAVGKWAIEVEKRLCAMLGRQWSPGNISIESLCDELDATRPGPGRYGFVTVPVEPMKAIVDLLVRQTAVGIPLNVNQRAGLLTLQSMIGDALAAAPAPPAEPFGADFIRSIEP